jgi:ABC-2 type transport system permease protein
MTRERLPGLASILIRLKLRLMANRTRRGLSAQVLLAVSSLLALASGALLGTLVAAIGRFGDERAARSALILGATALFVVWIVFPLLTFGSDETLDPARLVLFPLRPRALTRALLAASFVGPAPTVALLATVGAIVGFAGGGGWIVVPAAVLLLALTATAARTLSTALAAGLTSRRGRDITLIVAPLIGLAFQGVRFLGFVAFGAGLVDRIDDVLRWLPPGMLAQSVIDGRAGHLFVALAELVPAAVLIPLLLLYWSRVLDRSMTVVKDGATRGTRRTRRNSRPLASLPLLFGRLPFIAAVPWGAVAAKELRYLQREPRRKVLALNSIVLGGFLALGPVIGGARDSRVVLLATLAGYLALFNSSNQLGFDGAAYWIDVVTGDTIRSALIGKNVATALQVVVVTTAFSIVAAVLTGGWIYLPAAVLLSLAGLGVGLATANVVSVRFPMRLPESQNPFAGRGSGQGCATSLVLLVGVVIQNMLLAPVAIAAFGAALINPVALVVVTPLSIVYGAVLWRTGLTIATSWARTHQPEILAAIDPARGA